MSSSKNSPVYYLHCQCAILLSFHTFFQVNSLSDHRCKHDDRWNSCIHSSKPYFFATSHLQMILCNVVIVKPVSPVPVHGNLLGHATARKESLCLNMTCGCRSLNTHRVQVTPVHSHVRKTQTCTGHKSSKVPCVNGPLKNNMILS